MRLLSLGLPEPYRLVQDSARKGLVPDPRGAFRTLLWCLQNGWHLFCSVSALAMLVVKHFEKISHIGSLLNQYLWLGKFHLLISYIPELTPWKWEEFFLINLDSRLLNLEGFYNRLLSPTPWVTDSGLGLGTRFLCSTLMILMLQGQGPHFESHCFRSLSSLGELRACYSNHFLCWVVQIRNMGEKNCSRLQVNKVWATDQIWATIYSCKSSWFKTQPCPFVCELSIAAFMLHW